MKRTIRGVGIAAFLLVLAVFLSCGEDEGTRGGHKVADDDDSPGPGDGGSDDDEDDSREMCEDFMNALYDECGSNLDGLTEAQAVEYCQTTYEVNYQCFANCYDIHVNVCNCCYYQGCMDMCH